MTELRPVGQLHPPDLQGSTLDVDFTNG